MAAGHRCRLARRLVWRRRHGRSLRDRQAAHRALHRQARPRIDVRRGGLPRRSAHLDILLIATGADGRGIHAHPCQTPRAQEYFLLPVIGQSNRTVVALTITSTSPPGEAHMQPPSWRCFLGGCSGQYSPSLKRRSVIAKRSVLGREPEGGNFCVHIWFYSTQFHTKGSSHGGTYKCPKCRLGRPGQRTGSSRGGQRSPRKRGLRDRQVPKETALYDIGADAG